MSDVQLDKTNEGHSGTEIQAQPDFNQAYVLQVRERINNPPNRDVDGLRGVGIGRGHGVVGWTHDARLDREAHFDLDNSPTNVDLPHPGGVAGVVGIGYNSGAVGLDDTGVIGASRLNSGVFGTSEGGRGVSGLASDSGANGDGVHGLAQGTGSGVFGHSDNGNGVTGDAPNGIGVSGGSTQKNGVAGRSANDDGVRGDSAAQGKSGVFGFNSAVSGLALGVSGETPSPGGVGVFGFSTAVDPANPNAGGTGAAGDSVAGNGVRGHSQRNDGVRGDSDAQGKSGVFGFNAAAIGLAFGVSGETPSPGGVGVFGFSTAVDPKNPNSGGTGTAGDSVAGNGVRGHSQKNDGVRGDSDAQGKSGVFGFNSNTGPGLVFGVSGESVSPDGFGVFGFSNTGKGVGGNSKTNYGGEFTGGRAPLRLDPATTKGHPTGIHQRGELYVDVAGSLFYCSADGNPGTWHKLA